MKKIDILKFYAVPLFLSALALPGCLKDPDTGGRSGGGDNVTVVIRVPGASRGNTRAITQGGIADNAVNRVDILMFDHNTSVYAGRVFSNHITTVQPNENIKSFTVRMPKGQYDLMVLANSKEIIDGTVLSEGSTTKAQAYGLLTESLPARTAGVPLSGVWNAQPGSAGYKDFPMWGEVADFDPSATGSINNLPLVRMLAKMNVSFESQEASDKLAIEEIYLCNYNSEGYLASVSAAWGDPGAILSQFTPNVVPASGRTGFDNRLIYANTGVYTTVIGSGLSVIRDEIFLFEAAKPADQTDEARLNSVCLIVKGSYQGGVSTYYRIDMIDGDGDGDYFDIIRNHYYDVRITDIGGPGHTSGQEAYDSTPFNITTVINAWNESGMNDVTYNGQYQLVVDRSEFDMFDQSGAEPQVIRIYTDFPDGWRIETDPGNEWIRANPSSYDNGAIPFESVEAEITCEFNDWNEERTGFFTIVAGPLRKEIAVTQSDGSIIFTGGSADLLYIMDDGTLGVGKWSPLGPVNQGNVLYFKFGGTVGYSIPQDISGHLPTDPFQQLSWGQVYDYLGVGGIDNLVKFNPTGVTIENFTGNIYDYNFESSDNTLPNLPGYVAGYFDNLSVYYTSSPLYHNGDNVKLNGRGDPCMLAGLKASATAAEIDSHTSLWRTPTANEQVDFVGGGPSMRVYPPTVNSAHEIMDDTYWGDNIVGYEGPENTNWSGGWFPIGVQHGEGVFLPGVGYGIPQGMGGQGSMSAYYTNTSLIGGTDIKRGNYAMNGNTAYVLYPIRDQFIFSDYIYGGATPMRCVRIPNSEPVPLVKQDYQRITLNRDAETGATGYYLNTIAEDAGIYFKYGSIIGISSSTYYDTYYYLDNDDNGMNDQPFYGDTDISWVPGEAPPYDMSAWDDIPYMETYYPGMGVMIDDDYHTPENVKRGLGDPCRLIGMDLYYISNTDAQDLTQDDIDNRIWRIATYDDDTAFMSGGSQGTDAYFNMPGRWVNPGNSNGVFLSPTGGRGADGSIFGQREFGAFWSANHSSGTQPYIMLSQIDYLYTTDNVLPPNGAYGVRCVRRNDVP